MANFSRHSGRSRLIYSPVASIYLPAGLSKGSAFLRSRSAGVNGNLPPVDVQLRTPDLPGLKAPPVVVFDALEDSSEDQTIGRRKQKASD
jgi:hypothetical protein